jgi:hypothetical protein
MPGPDRREALDQKIADSLQSTADELRQSLDDGLARAHEEVGRLLREVATPDLTDLLSATSELAEATSEQQVLESLVGAATRFAERAVFFVISVEGVRSWAAAGFEDDASNGIAVEDLSSGVWQVVTREQGATELSPEQCGEVLTGVSAEAASHGALVPLALGDQIAGALYADVTSGPAPALAALQLLTQSAGRAIESLSLRSEPGSPSLRSASDGHLPTMPLWNPAEAPTPET